MGFEVRSISLCAENVYNAPSQNTWDVCDNALNKNGEGVTNVADGTCLNTPQDLVRFSNNWCKEERTQTIMEKQL